MVIAKSKDKKKLQEVALTKENSVLSEEEMKACKNGLLEREKKTNKEVIDFLQQYINNGNNGIIPQNFQKKAHLGVNSFNAVFSRNRKLSRRFKQRICLGIGIMWEEIVRNHIDRYYPKLPPEKRQEKVQKLRKEFIWHLGTPMKETFEMMQEGVKLEPYAIYMNKTSGNKNNFTKNV